MAETKKMKRLYVMQLAGASRNSISMMRDEFGYVFLFLYFNSTFFFIEYLSDDDLVLSILFLLRLLSTCFFLKNFQRPLFCFLTFDKFSWHSGSSMCMVSRIFFRGSYGVSDFCFRVI